MRRLAPLLSVFSSSDIIFSAARMRALGGDLLATCQHTSAYVSIRQHTSAYVSIVGRAHARVGR
jgi:hypothetical protein